MEERITELEIRLTHFEDTIETLNRAVIAQQGVIDELLFQVEILEKRIKASAAGSPVAHESEETPPPHY
jgi:SlyX protein